MGLSWFSLLPMLGSWVCSRVCTVAVCVCALLVRQ